MTTEPSAADNSIIFWKGLGILTGLMLLLCVIAWASDRHRLKHAGHGPDESAAEIREEYGILLREAENRSSEEAQINSDLANTLLEKEGKLNELRGQLNAMSDELQAAKKKSAQDDKQLLEKLRQTEDALSASRAAEHEAQRASSLSRARIARLEEHRDSLLRRSEKFATERAELEERISASSQVTRESDKERERWRLQTAELTAQVAELEEALSQRGDEAMSQIDRLNQQLRKSQERLDAEAAQAKAVQASLAKMTAEIETMKKVTRAAEAKVVEMSRRHADEIAQLRAAKAAAETAAANAAKTEPVETIEASPTDVSGDSLAELRILRARDESRAMEIRRLEQEVAALKAALERAKP